MSSTMTIPSGTTERRRSSSSANEKFPDFDANINAGIDSISVNQEQSATRVSGRTPSPSKLNGILENGPWQSQRDGHLAWGIGSNNVAGPRQHGRQKSIGDAIRTIRGRKASVSENAQELAEALKAPLSVKLVVSAKLLCLMYDCLIYARFFASSGT